MPGDGTGGEGVRAGWGPFNDGDTLLMARYELDELQCGGGEDIDRQSGAESKV